MISRPAKLDPKLAKDLRAHHFGERMKTNYTTLNQSKFRGKEPTLNIKKKPMFFWYWIVIYFINFTINYNWINAKEKIDCLIKEVHGRCQCLKDDQKNQVVFENHLFIED